MRPVSCTTFAIVAMWATIGQAQGRLPTLAEAQQISAETGRPIFAMAGNET